MKLSFSFEKAEEFACLTQHTHTYTEKDCSDASQNMQICRDDKVCKHAESIRERETKF